MPLALLIAIGVVAVVALALLVTWLLGYSPLSRERPLRASATEATERTTDLAAEFFDWLRLGR
jgi:energy-converting hydrogenase Eha subunit A